tara:strand:- start:994 stop:1485 length:492 start_codon:yes stop_codon:yes gene_type:complete
MASKVHYEDNLFFLHSILRTVESGLRLDVDAEYFRDKVLEDVFFIDATLMRMFSSLKENPYLINRASYLRSLRRTVVAFSDFLEQFARGDLGFSDAVSAYSERLTTAQHAHHQVRKEIDLILDQEDPDEETASVVSSQEYGFLLASDEENEDEDDTTDNAAGS